MLKLDWYIGRVILKNVAVVFSIVFVIQFFTLFVQESTQVDRDYQIGGAVIYSLLYLPVRAYEMLPVILLIGGIIGLGTLANGSELTTIRATGKSIGFITRSMAKTGIPLVLILFLIGEFIALPLIDVAEEYKAINLGKKISMSTSDSFWIKDSDRFININGINAGKEDQFRYFKIDETNNLREILTAKRSISTDDGWRLYDVMITSIGESSTETMHHDEFELKTSFDKEGLGKLTLNPRHIRLLELYGYSKYLEVNDLESEPYFFSFWNRLFQPIAALAMLFLALPFVFGSLREKSITQRVMTGVFVGVGFFTLSQIVNHLGLMVDISAIVGAAIPTMAIIALWGYLFGRADKLH